MPQTTAGNIFRPALRQRITKMVIQQMLQANGIATLSIVRLNNKSGLAVEIHTPNKESEQQAKTLLTPFTLHFEYL